jgi:hypothetical protein
VLGSTFCEIAASDPGKSSSVCGSGMLTNSTRIAILGEMAGEELLGLHNSNPLDCPGVQIDAAVESVRWL